MEAESAGQNPPQAHVVIDGSPREDKKLRAVFTFPDGKKKTTHFGGKGYSDYTIHNDEERKNRYEIRHARREDWDDFTTAGALSKWILWNKPSLKGGFDHFLALFSLTGELKVKTSLAGNAAPCLQCGRDSYRSPSVTVDAVATRETDDGLELLMIERGPDPSVWAGMWAFPGGFVDYGEDPEDAVLREMLEETGVVGENPRILHVLGAPGRDPRKHCIGLFYLVEADHEAEPQGADDAVSAAWVPISDLSVENVAADHLSVVDLMRE